MKKRIIKEKQIEAFARHLLHQEKSKNTIKQYVCALVQFASWLQAGAHGGNLPSTGNGANRSASGNDGNQSAFGNSGSWWTFGNCSSQPSPGNDGSRRPFGGSWPLGRCLPAGKRDSRWPWQRSTSDRRLWPCGAGSRATVTRDLVLAYKDHLKLQYKPRSVNAKLAALNCFFTWQNWPELKVSALKLQQRMFLDENQLLEKPEYVALATEAIKQGKLQLALMMETMCCTGMRVSELQYVTVEAVRSGSCKIDCKGKIREIFLTDDLQSKLQKYIDVKGKTCGQVFVTRSGRPVDPRNIWREMKGLCEKTGIAPEKVFPHNLRHLFARTYYEQMKDIVRLADLLGHSSVQTTRIYTRTSGTAEKAAVNQLALSINYGKVA